MNGPHLTPSAMRTPTKRKCQRVACQQDNPRDHSSWCSDLCERIAKGLAAISAGNGRDADMGRGAAVVHAFHWLDVRCRETA